MVPLNVRIDVPELIVVVPAPDWPVVPMFPTVTPSPPKLIVLKVPPAAVPTSPMEMDPVPAARVKLRAVPEQFEEPAIEIFPLFEVNVILPVFNRREVVPVGIRQDPPAEPL